MGLSELEKAYAFYSSILVFKALVLTAVTIARRFKYQAFSKTQDHPAVEEVRRCHLNDIENLVPFGLLGWLYCQTDPSPCWALFHFRLFALMRILHTPAFIFTEGKFPRGPIALMGILINVSLAVQCMAYFS
ncbi:Microsomal glutathione S-transferase 1 [Fasciolopsis buskii]|uniref:Microsomal glutathione S-transferase 1 n=1 Tax=Fasciolopsis buskii TaxID=27845 RepID=A0A8E0RND4_9TREM|nr:Microsomal glutathione S-transferase 1 [Fasciolopsis buski]